MPALAAFAALGCAVALLAMALVKWDLPPAFFVWWRLVFEVSRFLETEKLRDVGSADVSAVVCRSDPTRLDASASGSVGSKGRL